MGGHEADREEIEIRTLTKGRTLEEPTYHPTKRRQRLR